MGKRILIIDDERDMRTYLGALLRRAGYEVQVAENGEDGLSKVGSFAPHLITLDLLMPKQSGVMAFESLRKSPETAQLPVVIVSGLANQQALLDPLDNQLRPPDAIVDKPIDREAFLNTIAQLLGS